MVSSPAQNPNEMTSCEYASCVTGSAAAGGTRPAREAGHRQVETVPEEMHGAGLAVEPAAELLEHRVRPVEHPAESFDRVAIPRRVLDILGKRGLHRHAERQLDDVDVDAELREQPVEARVELGDRHSTGEIERPPATIGGTDNEGVVNEVEGDVERRSSMVQAPRRQPTDIDVERDVPPVVARRGGRQPDLAHDLAVEVQCVLGRAPVAQMELRKLGRRCGCHPGQDRSARPRPAPAQLTAQETTNSFFGENALCHGPFVVPV